MLKLFKVQGDSLYPFFKDGQRVLCVKIFRYLNLSIGDTVVFFKKDYGLMIKKSKKLKK